MNVKEVQKRLWEQSREHQDHRESDLPLFPVNRYEQRIRNLMDLMHHPQWLMAAAERVLSRSKGKAPGIDGVTVSQFADCLGRQVETLRLELKRGTYRPKPLRRVEIPKANGKMRQLGIPCLRDKIVQEAIRMALEPIFEVEFHEHSYGFRPNRNTHQAVQRCQMLMKHGFTWIIEGDVKACFDEISHKAIIRAIRDKVMDNKFLDLITRFLKAGVMADGVFHATTKGVPQGGVVSPLLANAVLNRLDWFLHEKGMHGKAANERARINGRPNVRFVRYADDWCVFLTRTNKRHAEQLRAEIRDFLAAECGLRLSEEKTRITHVRDGFRFLGFNLEVSIGQGNRPVPKIKIPRDAITAVVRRLNERLRYRPSQESITIRIENANAVIRGWANYYSIAHNYAKHAGWLDNQAYWIAVKAICRKYDITTGQCHKRYVFAQRPGVHEQCTLRKFCDTKMKHDYRRPKTYTPGAAFYEEATDSVTFGRREHRREGSADLKWIALARDGFRCCQCGKSVTDKTCHADHTRSVHSFASFAMAHDPENVKILCLECHRKKTQSDKG